MQTVVDLSKARGDAIRSHVQRAIDARTKALGGALTIWLQGLARRELARTLDDLPGLLSDARGKVSKAADDDSKDLQRLFDLIQAYGAVQLEEGAQRAYEMSASRPSRQQSARHRTLVPPGLIFDYLQAKEPLLQRLAPGSREMARESVRRLIEDAMREQPTPSAGEIARRIRTAFHGPGGAIGSAQPTDATVQTGQTSAYATDKGVMYAFSSERAAAIARTELVQLENTGIYTGLEMVGTSETEWLAVTSDRASGERKHWKMDGQRRKLGDPFVNTATSNKLRYPGDPFAPIEETINCRCTMRAVSFKKPG